MDKNSEMQTQIIMQTCRNSID